MYNFNSYINRSNTYSLKKNINRLYFISSLYYTLLFLVCQYLECNSSFTEEIEVFL